MAGDWIKMRVNLATHPKVLAIAEHLASCEDYQDWSTMAGFVPALGGTQAEAERDFVASLRVTRYVTVCALLRFWGYANEHARDEFIATLRISDVDEIVQVPGFGAALASVGWALFDDERRGLSLPGFNEFNTSGHERSANAKSNAERQREYRARLKAQESNAERDNESDVTRNRREEKRREEVIDTAPSPKSPRGTALPADWTLPDDWKAWAEANRPDVDVQTVAESFRDFWIAKPGKDGRKADWQATWRNWVRNQRAQQHRQAPQQSSIGSFV